MLMYYLRKLFPINYDVSERMSINYNALNALKFKPINHGILKLNTYPKKVNIIIVADNNNDTINELLFGITIKSTIRTPYTTTYFLECEEDKMNVIKDNVYGMILV